MRKKIFFGLVLLIFLLCVFIFTFFGDKHEKSKVEFVGENDVVLKVDNALPLSDELGIKKTSGDSGVVNFSLKSSHMNKKSSKYEIYVKQINSSNSINSNYIKLYLSEDRTNRPLTGSLVYSDLKVSSADTKSRRLYVGTIKKNEIINFNLKMWLSDNYTVSNESRFFEIVLGVDVID